jgi:hypothetical protein
VETASSLCRNCEGASGDHRIIAFPMPGKSGRVSHLCLECIDRAVMAGARIAGIVGEPLRVYVGEDVTSQTDAFRALQILVRLVKESIPKK